MNKSRSRTTWSGFPDKGGRFVSVWLSPDALCRPCTVTAEKKDRGPGNKPPGKSPPAKLGGGSAGGSCSDDLRNVVSAGDQPPPFFGETLDFNLNQTLLVIGNKSLLDPMVNGCLSHATNLRKADPAAEIVDGFLWSHDRT